MQPLENKVSIIIIIIPKYMYGHIPSYSTKQAKTLTIKFEDVTNEYLCSPVVPSFYITSSWPKVKRDATLHRQREVIQTTG